MDLSTILDPTTILVGFAFLLVGWYIFQTNKSRRCPPGPKRWPVLGNALFVISSKKYIFELLQDVHRDYGDVIRLQMGPSFNLVSIRGREKMHKALIDMNDAFKFRPRVPFAVKYIFNEKGVFFGNGQTHTALRKFTLGALRDFGVGRKGIEERIQDEATLLVEAMKKHNGKPMSYLTVFKKSVNNIIANIVYGTRFDYEDPQSQRLIDDIDTVFKTLGISLPENAFPFLRFLPGSKVSDFNLSPAIGNPTISNLIRFNTNQAVQQQDMLTKVFAIFKDLEQYAKSRIKEHRETFDPDNIRDFVDIFLQNEGSDDKVLNEDNLFRVIVDMFNAGTDTTATTFIWTIAHLLRQPEIQKKCREEILREVGPSRMVCLADKQNLPYLQALINETLRFCTIAPISAPHTVLEDTEFEGYVIPKDSLVLFHLSDMLYDKQVWGDPENFRPERFLDSSKHLETDEHFSPFSIGSRSCLGKQLARTELFIFLGTLIQRFEFKLPENQDPPSVKRMQTGITCQPPPYAFCAVSLDG